MSTQPAVKTFQTRDGSTISFLEKGEGKPVVLLHALMANAELNWVTTGLVDLLAEAGFKVVAPDFRGHGRSDKPLEAGAYSLPGLIEDSTSLIESLALGSCHVVGYSLGALVAAYIAASGSVAIERVVLAGIGAADIATLPQSPQIDALAGALLADEAQSITIPELKAARLAIEEWGTEPRAVAAIYRALQITHRVDLSAIEAPVLVLNGAEDVPTSDVGDEIPHALTVTIQGDHMSAPYDPAFSRSIARFLQGQPIG